ncbi:hypothetical protein NDU88_010354 [Pleurodeles waltl]|uniref:Uncharacterized protein n=1 Tax=Pleurodeles waltl TaxID=8319 RepID=A0AAV7S0F5_PLEWA|nr:hypothetical protein NDU88_010354 [Pleurodeles waltl]
MVVLRGERWRRQHTIRSNMVKDKATKLAQANKIINHSHTLPPTERMEVAGDHRLGTLEMVTHNPSLADLVEAINYSKAKMVNKIEAVAVDITSLCADLCKVSERVTDTEQNMEVLQREVCSLNATVSGLQKLTLRLDERVEDSKGRSRRKNLHFVGFPEKVEEPSTELFLEEWITTILKPESLSYFFTIKRAHRALVPPRAIIAHLFNYCDCHVIFQCTQALKLPSYQGRHISIFPNYTQQVQEQQKTFTAVIQPSISSQTSGPT